MTKPPPPASEEGREPEPKQTPRFYSGVELFILLVLLRGFNALTLNTFFQPDEYFQALEPAHALVFGYGELTWEWSYGLRSFVHPLLYVLPYRLVQWAGWGPTAVIYAPKVLNGLLAAVGDYYTHQFVARVSGLTVLAQWALFASVSSGWNWYMLTRSFSNTLEMILTAVALAHWPWNRHMNVKDTVVALGAAALSCVIRPSNGLLWGFLGAALLIRAKTHLIRAKLTLLAVAVGIFVLGAATTIDYLYYGELTVPMVAFVRFNVLSSLLVFYGRAPWHFYLAQGLPLILLGHLPFTALGALRVRGHFLVLVVLVMAVYSGIPHKEVRFLYPLQPFIAYFTAHGFVRASQTRWGGWAVKASLVANIIVAVYFSQVHEAGVLTAMNALQTDEDLQSVAFYMPCHSTPMQSHLHLDIPVRTLNCDPPVHLMGEPANTVAQYMDESDVFYANPEAFLAAVVEWPTHLVFFEGLEAVMRTVAGDQYTQQRRFFNGFFHWDPRRRGEVVVWKRRDLETSEPVARAAERVEPNGQSDLSKDPESDLTDDLESDLDDDLESDLTDDLESDLSDESELEADE